MCLIEGPSPLHSFKRSATAKVLVIFQCFLIASGSTAQWVRNIVTSKCLLDGSEKRQTVTNANLHIGHVRKYIWFVEIGGLQFHLLAELTLQPQLILLILVVIILQTCFKGRPVLGRSSHQERFRAGAVQVVNIIESMAQLGTCGELLLCF